MNTTGTILNQLENLSRVLFEQILGFDAIGGTLNFDAQKVEFNEGFLVSKKAPSIILDRAKFAELEVLELSNLLKNLYFKATSFDYIGFWQDNNKVYIDLSCHILNKSQAINLGLANDQIAIYDCKNDLPIYLEKYQF